MDMYVVLILGLVALFVIGHWAGCWKDVKRADAFAREAEARAREAEANLALAKMNKTNTEETNSDSKNIPS